MKFVPETCQCNLRPRAARIRNCTRSIAAKLKGSPPSQEIAIYISGIVWVLHGVIMTKL